MILDYEEYEGSMEEEIMSFNHNVVVNTQELLEDFNVDRKEFEESNTEEIYLLSTLSKVRYNLAIL